MDILPCAKAWETPRNTNISNQYVQQISRKITSEEKINNIRNSVQARLTPTQKVNEIAKHGKIVVKGYIDPKTKRWVKTESGRPTVNQPTIKSTPTTTQQAPPISISQLPNRTNKHMGPQERAFWERFNRQQQHPTATPQNDIKKSTTPVAKDALAKLQASRTGTSITSNESKLLPSAQAAINGTRTDNRFDRRNNTMEVMEGVVEVAE